MLDTRSTLLFPSQGRSCEQNVFSWLLQAVSNLVWLCKFSCAILLPVGLFWISRFISFILNTSSVAFSLFHFVLSSRTPIIWMSFVLCLFLYPIIFFLTHFSSFFTLFLFSWLFDSLYTTYLCLCLSTFCTGFLVILVFISEVIVFFLLSWVQSTLAIFFPSVFCPLIWF